jgi:unsaturated rhamnogalacturonyl hydrolase
MNAKEYAVASAKTMMKKFAAEKLPPEGHFHYHQGVFLSGMLALYECTGDEAYYLYTKRWVDAMLGENGIPKDMLTNEPDDLQPGVLLFTLYEKTGDPKYKNLLDKLVEWMLALKKNPDGGIWHKDFMEDQMWLDSMYMAGVITSRYAEKYGNDTHRDFVYKQMELMRAHTRDEKTGLYYHAWDYSKKAEWADPVTGCSASFWGRAMGWFAVSMFEIAKTLEDGAQRRDYIETGLALIDALLRFRDAKTGLWYQVVDKVEQSDNWPENSCTCLYVAAMCKAMRMGYLSRDYAEAAKRGYEGVIRSLEWKGEDLQIGNVCIGTGVGDYDFYCARPTSINDLHGAGAFLLMCTEMQKWMDA